MLTPKSSITLITANRTAKRSLLYEPGVWPRSDHRWLHGLCKCHFEWSSHRQVSLGATCCNFATMTLFLFVLRNRRKLSPRNHKCVWAGLISLFPHSGWMSWPCPWMIPTAWRRTWGSCWSTWVWRSETGTVKKALYGKLLHIPACVCSSANSCEACVFLASCMFCFDSVFRLFY